MNWLYSALALLLGFVGLDGRNPAVLPSLGMAFGAAALVRESRAGRRPGVRALAGLGCALSGLAAAIHFLASH